MNKYDFLSIMQQRLVGLPSQEVEERLCFYSEMIDDRIEEGVTEEEAVAALGSTDEVAQQILADIPLVKVIKESVRSKRRLTALEIILLILGFPVWLPLLLSAVAVVFSVYAALWAVIISLWTVFVSLVGCAVGGLIGGIVILATACPLVGMALVAVGLVCVGLSILSFFGCRAATQGAIWFWKKMALWIKGCFVRKGAA